MSNRSGRSGRSWYRLSSIVRPTAYSSRDPSSPHYVIEPPLSPAVSPSPPPPPRSAPKEVRETKPNPVVSPRPSVKYETPKWRHERETTSQKILTFSDNTKKEQQHDDEPSPAAPPPPPRSPPNVVKETKPSPVLLSQTTKYEPPKQQEQQTSYIDQTRSSHNNNTMMSPAAQPSHPPPQLMCPPLRPPSPEEVQEAKQTLVSSSPSISQEPHKPMQEHETTQQKNIVTLSEKTNIVHGPNETLYPELDDDAIIGTQSVITISGENKGAVMEILQSPSKTRGPYLISNGPEKSAEEKSKPKRKSNNHNSKGENRFVNSNVQIINGSVVCNSSETHHDPGVHLSLYRNSSTGNDFIIKDHGNGYTSSFN
ncbi:hypothetical protein CARUB_v10017477mg [Capsella rubella]|uniref:Uncharacterized protein n=1 Tax=Capsella rubella TaxID=81985 RepID=R0FL32_9BRAS|nr:pollen-specific leucine-rich repeat extensin-like protein 1 [Capsella rubella]EOA23172.1 hypothetical protein CARUB_v10017477mg [Capsella rubella]